MAGKEQQRLAANVDGDSDQFGDPGERGVVKGRGSIESAQQWRVSTSGQVSDDDADCWGRHAATRAPITRRWERAVCGRHRESAEAGVPYR